MLLRLDPHFRYRCFSDIVTEHGFACTISLRGKFTPLSTVSTKLVKYTSLYTCEVMVSVIHVTYCGLMITTKVSRISDVYQL